MVKGRPTTVAEVKSPDERAAQLQLKLEIAREIAGSESSREERLQLWKERTDKSEQTLYRRLAQLKEASLSDSHEK